VQQVATWTCPSCRAQRRAKFCPDCGEQRLRPGDLSLRDIAAQFVKNVTAVDGKLFRSYLTVLRAPGSLTVAHIAGNRRAYLGPLALFFVANAVFAALQSLLGLNVLSSPLASHLNDQDWSGPARGLVAARLEASGQTIAAYAPVFDAAAIFNAKALMILMAAAFAPLARLAFPRPRRAAGVDAVFALHLYVFVLTLLCVAMLLAEVELLFGGAGMSSPAVDVALSLFNLAACTVYLYLALGTVYHSGGTARVLKTVGLVACVATLFVLYRFGIFLITLYTT
jgi:hypothetical protein